MRHEAIAMSIGADSTANIPLVRQVQIHTTCAIFANQIFHHSFILRAIIGASAIDEISAGAQSLPRIIHYFALAGRTLRHKLRSPLCHSLSIFAKHTLATTRHIGSYHIEEAGKAAHRRTVAIGHHTGGISPFHHVLFQNLRPATHNLVADHERAFGKRIDGGGSLPAGSGTQVEIAHRSVDELRHYVLQNHRRCILHIVSPGM